MPIAVDRGLGDLSPLRWQFFGEGKQNRKEGQERARQREQRPKKTETELQNRVRDGRGTQNWLRGFVEPPEYLRVNR